MTVDKQRASVRCAVFEPIPGVLYGTRNGKEVDLDVLVCDESSGGFGLTTIHAPPFEKGERVIISCSDREVLCQIEYVGKTANSEFKIGLKVEEELLDSPEKENVGGSGETHDHQSGSYSSPIFFAAIVVVLTIAGLIFIPVKVSNSTQNGSGQAKRNTSVMKIIYDTVFGTNRKSE